MSVSYIAEKGLCLLEIEGLSQLQNVLKSFEDFR